MPASAPRFSVVMSRGGSSYDGSQISIWFHFRQMRLAMPLHKPATSPCVAWGWRSISIPVGMNTDRTSKAVSQSSTTSPDCPASAGPHPASVIRTCTAISSTSPRTALRSCRRAGRRRRTHRRRSPVERRNEAGHGDPGAVIAEAMHKQCIRSAAIRHCFTQSAAMPFQPFWRSRSSFK